MEKGLKKNRRILKYLKKDINEVSNFSFNELHFWINELKRKLSDNDLKIADEIINEILKRIEFILDVGLSYLTLNRETKTLSGGESQRGNICFTQIGSQLQDVLV